MKNLSKKSTYIALGLAVVAVAATIILIFVYDKKKNGSGSSSTGTSSGSGTGSSTTTTTKTNVFPLKKGSKGQEVAKLQTQLNAWNNYYWFGLSVKPPYQTLAVDGDFGSRTEANLNFILKRKTISESAYKSFIAMKFETPSNGDFWTGSQYSFLKLT